MHELRQHGLTSSATFNERVDAFWSWFDIDVDPASSISPILERFGLNLERILGPAQTAKAFAQFNNCSENWRKDIEETNFYLETPLGEKLNKLSAYAVFGLTGRDFMSEDKVLETVQSVEDLLLDCPADHWLPEPEFSPLMPTIRLARARWNLDNGKGVDPDGLALLGGVKLSRIRNMMSGSAPELPKDVMGLLSNEAARAWLENRDTYLATMTATEEAAELPPATEMRPAFVPVARDGSVFLPDVHRNGSYQIGEKGQEETHRTFEAALARLQAMPVARWRRPNESDNWGIVSAVEWRRIDLNSL